MDKKLQTINTYNKSAKAFARKFNLLPTRKADIKRGFGLVKKENPKILELGCANGRDTREVLKYTKNYLGVDISQELIKIAKRETPEGKFKVADAEKFEFPKNIDIIFAFASLIHSDKNNLRRIFERVYKSLNMGGILYVSMKHGAYQEKIKNDKFGTRVFYLYALDELAKIAGKKYELVYKNIRNIRGQKWLVAVFKKIPE